MTLPQNSPLPHLSEHAKQVGLSELHFHVCGKDVVMGPWRGM